MSLVAYAICKNEQNKISQFISQIALFDQVIVLDTGSTDQSVQLLREAGVVVHERKWTHFDFSEARNYCASLAPSHTTWLMSLDFNDAFELTDLIKQEIIQSPAHALTVNYLSSLGPQYLEHKIRLHRPNCMAWKKAVHEYLVPTQDPIQIGHVNFNVTKQVNITSHKQKFYAEICDREHINHPQDPHYAWWAIGYYWGINDRHTACYYAQSYLDHTTAYTVDWRVKCWLFLSEHQRTHNWDSAVDHAFRALSESLRFRQHVPTLISDCLDQLNSLGVNILVSPNKDS